MSARLTHCSESTPSLPLAKQVVESSFLPREVHLVVALILVALCSLLYLRTVDFPMQFDDLVYVRDNPLVSQPQTLERYTDARAFVETTRDLGLEHDLARNFMLRPVAYATFHANYLFDGYEPRWYRVVNIAVHAANAVLIYALLFTLLQASSMDCRKVAFIAGTTALLFVAHPLATESVTYIVQRFTSLAAFFYLLALVLHFRSLYVRRSLHRWLIQGGAVTALVLGMLTKECVVTAPLMVVLLDRLVLGVPWRVAMRRSLSLLLCLPLVPVMVFFTAWAQGSDGLSLAAAIHVSDARDLPMSHGDYLLTELTVMLGYLSHILWPSGLSIDPDWPLYRSVLAAPVLAAIAMIAGIIGVAWWWWKRQPANALVAGVLAFVLWFFATVFVSSGLVPLPDLAADHRTYLPSVGVFAVLALLLHRGMGARPLWSGTIVVGSVVALACSTWLRNDAWRSTVTLWEDAVAKSPGKYRAWGNLGTAYGEHSRAEDAVRCYRKARDLETRYETAYVNAAILLNHLHRYPEALEECQRLVQMNPEAGAHAEVQHNMALAQIGVGDVKAGMGRLERLVQSFPNYRPAQVVLGLMHSRFHQPREALRYWQSAVRIEPADPQLARLMRAAEIAAARSP